MALPTDDTFSEFMRTTEPRLRWALIAGYGSQLRREPTSHAKAHAEQVRSVSVARFGRRVGELPQTVAESVDETLRLHFQL